MYLLTKSRFLKSILSGFIVLSIVLVSYAPGFQVPKQTEAAPAFETNPAIITNTILTAVKSVITAVQSTLSAGYNLISSWGTHILTLKENWLDGIAWYVINLILHQLAQSTIQWINSGFKGSPAFVTDLGGFMRGIGDQVAGEFINGTALGFLCSPFRLDVQMALKLQYAQRINFNSQCTLSGAVNNMEAFLAGDFLAGGWDGWFKMTSDPRNNPYGALLLAQEELSWRLSNARGQEMSNLNFSKGFLSVKECGYRENGECEIVTPGTAIEHQLNSTLDIPANRLIVADEINEIIAALLGQLVKKAFAGAGGLRGLTSSSYGAGSGSYFTNLMSDKTTLGFNYHNTSTPQQYMNSWGNLTSGVTEINGGAGGGGNTGVAGNKCEYPNPGKVSTLSFDANLSKGHLGRLDQIGIVASDGSTPPEEAGGGSSIRLRPSTGRITEPTQVRHQISFTTPSALGTKIYIGVTPAGGSKNGTYPSSGQSLSLWPNLYGTSADAGILWPRHSNNMKEAYIGAFTINASVGIRPDDDWTSSVIILQPNTTYYFNMNYTCDFRVDLTEGLCDDFITIKSWPPGSGINDFIPTQAQINAFVPECSAGGANSCEAVGIPPKGPQYHTDFIFTGSDLTNAQKNYNWLMQNYGSSWAYWYIYTSDALKLHNQFRFAFDPEAAGIINTFGNQGNYGLPEGTWFPWGMGVRDGKIGAANPPSSIQLPYPDDDEIGGVAICGSGETSE